MLNFCQIVCKITILSNKFVQLKLDLFENVLILDQIIYHEKNIGFIIYRRNVILSEWTNQRRN